MWGNFDVDHIFVRFKRPAALEDSPKNTWKMRGTMLSGQTKHHWCPLGDMWGNLFHMPTCGQASELVSISQEAEQSRQELLVGDYI